MYRPMILLTESRDLLIRVSNLVEAEWQQMFVYVNVCVCVSLYECLCRIETKIFTVIEL
jgi:hypothetical protein